MRFVFYGGICHTTNPSGTSADWSLDQTIEQKERSIERNHLLAIVTIRLILKIYIIIMASFKEKNE